MGKATICALCSSATISKAVGWDMLLPVCSDEALWSCRLEAVFSKGRGYELVSLSGQWENKLQGEQGSLFVVMTQANPSPKFSG